MEDLPVIDMAPYLQYVVDGKKTPQVEKSCKQVADSLHKYGLLTIKDPRLDPKKNEEFLDMMEQYYEQDTAVKKGDERADMHYQVGVTPENIELPRNHCQRVREQIPEDQQPVTLCPPGKDPKCRFFWRVGERPENTEFAELNAEPVIPDNFPQWAEIMDGRGNSFINAVMTIAGMAAIGLDIPEDSFQNLLKQGPHLLGPTGSNLYNYGEVNTVLAGYHYDLNFLTIHDKSRFPGLFVWTREGKRVAVKVPQGCLLVQAGAQAEYLTGGHVLAGFHEVIVSEATVKTIEKRRAEGKSLWRVSSTLFSHVQSDKILMPVGRFNTAETAKKFPALKAGKFVENELKLIQLAQH